MTSMYTIIFDAGAAPPPLILSALAVLVHQTQVYTSGPLASTLTTAAQQLTAAAAAAANTQQQQQLLSTLSGQLSAAAALFVELARTVSAALLAVQGNDIALNNNMVAVLRRGAEGRLEPSWPTFYPNIVEGGATGTAAAADGENLISVCMSV